MRPAAAPPALLRRCCCRCCCHARRRRRCCWLLRLAWWLCFVLRAKFACVEGATAAVLPLPASEHCRQQKAIDKRARGLLLLPLLIHVAVADGSVARPRPSRPAARLSGPVPPWFEQVPCNRECPEEIPMLPTEISTRPAVPTPQLKAPPEWRDTRAGGKAQQSPTGTPPTGPCAAHLCSTTTWLSLSGSNFGPSPPPLLQTTVLHHPERQAQSSLTSTTQELTPLFQSNTQTNVCYPRCSSFVCH